MMGMDQDNVVLAPWTTDQVSRQRHRLANTNQSSSAASSSSSAASDAVNTLSGLYPTTTSLYPSRSSTQTADTPQPVRFTNVDQIIAKAALRHEDQAGHRADHGTAAPAAPHPGGPRRRLQHPRHGGNGRR